MAVAANVVELLCTAQLQLPAAASPQTPTFCTVSRPVRSCSSKVSFFFFNDTATTEIYTNAYSRGSFVRDRRCAAKADSSRAPQLAPSRSTTVATTSSP